MCGRFVREVPISDIAEEFGVDQPTFDMKPSYNIAPTNNVAIIIDDGRKRLVQSRWGLIPFWAKDPFSGFKMINARAETLAEKPTFKKAFMEQRCLVVASGFYEWREEDKVKMPVYVHLKPRALFGFAGLYNFWTSPEGESICTCTIVTVEANDRLRQVHDRMPAILQKQDEPLWIAQDADSGGLHNMLKPYPSNKMDFYDVSRAVNSAKNDSAENIVPV
jgi:putative SOS response-associated peptidase YedK